MYHTIVIVGNLGRDPEMRYTPSGQAVTNFSMATSRQYTDSGGQRVEETTWFRVSVWGKQAEVCNQYLKKGRTVLVEGRLVSDPKTGGPRVWQGQNGPGASYEVSATTVRFLGGREGQAQSSGEAGYATGENSAPYPEAESDIPF